MFENFDTAGERVSAAIAYCYGVRCTCWPWLKLPVWLFWIASMGPVPWAGPSEASEKSPAIWSSVLGIG